MLPLITNLYYMNKLMGSKGQLTRSITDAGILPSSRGGAYRC
jgi:hypothetical protein